MVTLTAVLGVYRLGTWNQYVRSFMPDTSHESLELVPSVSVWDMAQVSILAKLSSPFLSRLNFLPFHL